VYYSIILICKPIELISKYTSVITDNKKGILVPSPYLKYGLQVQPSQSEYIFLDSAGSNQRGRFEMCFIDIGTWYSVGASIGIIRGVHNGMKTVLLNKQTRIYNRTL